MNYGWGGYGNGYFALTNLVSGTTPGGETTYFDRGHQIIVNIMPASAYPQGCTGTRNITGKEGLIDDGSGNQLYPNNMDCYTIIHPSCDNAEVAITFKQFDLEAEDYVELYAGPDNTYPLIGKFDMANPPSVTTPYNSLSGSLLIRFVTNSSGQGNGWDVSYTAKSCGYFTTRTSKGNIVDGSGDCNYDDGLNCSYLANVTGATQFVINFANFNLDAGNLDYVALYAGSSSTPQATYRMNALPPSNIVVNSFKFKVKFVTNSDAVVNSGWSLHYTTNLSSNIPLVDLQNQVKFFPNPFVGDATVELTGLENQEVTLTLSNILGQTIGQKSFKNTQALYTVQLSELSNIPYGSGVYFLNIAASGESKTIKLLSE